MPMRRKNVDMLNGPLFANIVYFAFPLILSYWLQMAFNAADTIIVGKFAGHEALAAVGATSSLIMLLTTLFNGLATGANVNVANAIGSKDGDRVFKTVHTSITIAIIGGLIMTVVGLIFAEPLLKMMATPDNIIKQSALYMRVYFLGSLFLLTYNFGSAILRSKGDTKRPLYFLIISGILNVVLNIIFVVIFKLSVFGVALGTVLSQCLSSFLVINTLIKSDDFICLDLKKLGIDKEIAKLIIKIGIPAGISGMAYSITNVVVQSSINSFGSDIYIAANTAAANIENFVYIGTMAFSQACISFTSQNIGAKNYSRIKPILFYSVAITVSILLALGFGASLFSDQLLSFYTVEQAVIEAGKYRFKWVVRFSFINGILDVVTASLRGMGESFRPTILMLVGVCAVRLAWLYFVFPTHRMFEVIYMCFPISWTFTSIIEIILWIKCLKKFKM